MHYSFALLLCLFSIGSASKAQTLAELYENDFLVGTALAGGLSLNDPLGNSKKERSIIAREFNVLTAENCMKPMYMRPSIGSFLLKAAMLLLITRWKIIWKSSAIPWFGIIKCPRGFFQTAMDIN